LVVNQPFLLELLSTELGPQKGTSGDNSNRF